MLLLSLAWLGCSREAPGSSASGTPGPTPGEARSRAPVAAPCATDADCSVLLDSCDCTCLVVVGDLAEVARDRAKACRGAPKNCGVASPCAGMKARCDVAKKACVATR